MKPTFKYFIICLFALLCFNSCQDETVQEIDSPEESITPNSTVANLVRSTVANDGSVDNIMDNTDCFSVNLPVTIVVNDITITINTLDDLELIEDIFDEYENDEDVLDFLFPITIILNDYDEIVIENEEQLEDFIEECTDQEEDIIECVDFVYPISFSIYNADFQLIDTVEINSDQALYEFLDGLEDDDNGAIIASLNYPVSLIYADGTTVDVNSNQELEVAINAAEDECDDEDDEACDLNLQEIEEYLLECSVSAYFSNENELDELDFEFLEDDVLVVNGEPTVTETANWELSETEEGYVLTIENLETFNLANGNWLLEYCDEDDDWLDLEFTQSVNNNMITMALEIDCDDEEEEDYFECFGDYNLSVCDEDDGVEDGLGLFDLDLIFDNCPDDDVAYNFYETLADAENEVNPLPSSAYTNVANPQSIFSRVYLAEDPSVYEIFTHTLIVEDCTSFDCFENLELTFCDDEAPFDDGITWLDLTLLYDECESNNDIVVTYHETLADAESATNPLASPYVNTVAFSQTLYARAEAITNSDIFEIFQVNIVIEDCTQETCSEQEVDAHLVECIWNITNFNGDDHLVEWNLDFESSSNIVVVYTDSNTIDATWSTYQSSNGAVIVFSGVNGPDIQAITGEWLVVECGEGVLQLENFENDDVMIMEQNCN